MEILLLEDVNGIGKKNDLLVVGDGYALNCLLPQRKALVATPTVRKRYADQIRKRAEEKETEKQSQQQLVSSLTGKALSFIRKVAKGGKLYGSIGEKDIIGALLEQHKMPVSEAAVSLPEAIKSTGTFTVHIRFGESVVSLPVIVAAEKATEKVAKKAA